VQNVCTASETVKKGLPFLTKGLPFLTKGLPFLTKGLRPAAAHKSSARSERFPRLQAEKYFLPRTRRGKKSLTSILLLRQQNSTRFFDKLSGLHKAVRFFYHYS